MNRLRIIFTIFFLSTVVLALSSPVSAQFTMIEMGVNGMT